MKLSSSAGGGFSMPGMFVFVLHAYVSKTKQWMAQSIIGLPVVFSANELNEIILKNKRKNYR